MSTRVLASGISPVRWFHVLTVRGCHIKTIINHQLNKRDQEGREKGGEKGEREEKGEKIIKGLYPTQGFIGE